MAQEKLNGTDVLLYIRVASAWKPVVCLTEQSIERTANEIDVSGKCDAGSSDFLAGRKDRTIPFSGWAIANPADLTTLGFDALELLFDNGTSFDWKIAHKSSTTIYTPRFGKGVLLSLNETHADNDGIKFDASLRVNGTPVKIDPFL